MRVLVACEFSGTVRRALRARGHDAWSCDLLPAEDGDPHHFLNDVRNVVSLPWDMVIAHPPCTRLCNSGVRWLAERNLWAEMREAAEFFRMFLDLPVPRIAVENPTMHKHALAIVGRKHDFAVQPWQFGDPFQKRTCFWTKGLPPLKPTDVLPKEQRRQAVWLASPSPDRWKDRSRTYPGIATAIATQWG